MKKGTKKSDKKKATKIVKIERVNNTKSTKIALVILLALLVVLGVVLYRQNQPKYEGYWCSYQEKATIVVMLKNGYTAAQKQSIEDKISKYEDVQATGFFSKEEYADEIGVSPDEIELYDAIVVSFTSMDAIGTYVEELTKLDGVEKAEQSYAKAGVELYNIQKWGKYSFADSDEALEEDIIEGKYKEKKGVITFKPNDSKKETKVLYVKDNHLCADPSCKKVYFESDETCSSITAGETEIEE